MYRKLTVFSLIAAMMSIWGCVAAFQQLIDKPVVTFEKMSLNHTSLFEATPVFTFSVSNSNPMGLNIRNIVYSLKIDDKKFIKGVWDKNINLKAVGTSMVELPISFSYLDVFESASAFMESDMKSDHVSYTLSGTIGVGPFAVPYHITGNFNTPKLPIISLKQIEVSDINFTSASVVFVLCLENTNAFSLKLKELNYKIKLGGKEITKGSLAVSFIDKNTTLIFRESTKLSFFELGQPAYDTLTESSSVYELSGISKFIIFGTREKNLPFRRFGNTSILKTK